MPRPSPSPDWTLRRASIRRTLGGVALLLLCAACRGDSGAIDRQVFIDTYVDLRTAALANPGAQIRPAQRDSVLTKHGVTEEDLLQFAEVHGRDVWGAVEARLLPPEALPVPSP
jgi:hypothetical protein